MKHPMYTLFDGLCFVREKKQMVKNVNHKELCRYNDLPLFKFKYIHSFFTNQNSHSGAT